ncbi:MAG: hypothetical protein ACRDP6_02675 [Actinoallomurus sp.]
MNPRLRSLLLLPLATLVLLLSPLAVVIFPVAAGLLAGAYTFFAAFQRTAYSVICDVIRMPLDWWDIVRWIFTGVKHSERRAQAEYERAHEEMMEAVGRRGAQRRGAQQ